MVDVKLKSCPFCRETQIKLMEWPNDATICEVFCLNCKVNTGAKFTKKEAIAHWNTRAPSEELAQTQQALDIAKEDLAHMMGVAEIRRVRLNVVIDDLETKAHDACAVDCDRIARRDYAKELLSKAALASIKE